MATIQERIDAAAKRLSQLKEQAKKIEARKAYAEAKAERTKENRRKMLIGVAVLQLVKKGEISEGKLLALVDAGLTRESERAVFGLPPLAKPAPEGGQAAQG